MTSEAITMSHCHVVFVSSPSWLRLRTWVTTERNNFARHSPAFFCQCVACVVLYDTPSVLLVLLYDLLCTQGRP